MHSPPWGDGRRSGLGEVLVRIIAPQKDAKRWFTSDPRYGYRLKANFHQDYHYPRANVVIDVTTNSLGLRDREYDLSKPYRLRVLLLGDSFTFGEGLNAEDNFGGILEDRLNRNGDECMVLNSGVGGWGTIQQLTYARDHLELFRPDVIVLTFCRNDLNDDLEFLRFVKDQERDPSTRFAARSGWAVYSHLYRLVDTMMMIRSKGRRDPEEDRAADSSAADEVIAWNRTRQAISDFHRDFMTFNPQGMLLIQVTRPDPRTQAKFMSLTNGRNLFFVDVSERAKRLSRKEKRLSYDGHWSRAMHDISAEALLQALKKYVPR